MKRFYIDVRTNCVKDEDTLVTNLPHDKYAEFSYNTSDFYTETWCVGENKYLDVSYLDFEKESGLVPLVRDAAFTKHNVDPLYMHRYTVPVRMFEHILGSQGYVKGKDY